VNNNGFFLPFLKNDITLIFAGENVQKSNGHFKEKFGFGIHV